MKSTVIWRLLTLLIFGLAIIVFSYLKSVDSANPRFPLTWNQSQWISPQQAEPVGYYRAILDFQTDVKRAVLQLAATDSFELYLNGRKIEEKQRKSLMATGVYDVGPLLHVGKNVLAVAVKRATFPAAVGLRYELTAIDSLGRILKFQSTTQDKVMSLLPQQVGKHYWYSNQFDDASWSNTKAMQGSNAINLVRFDPQLLMTIAQPEAFLLSSPQSWRVSTQTQFDFDPEDKVQVWFAMVSESPYEVTVNGISLGIFPVNFEELELKSIQTKLVKGQNTLKVEFLTNGKTTQVAGGMVFDSKSQTKVNYLDKSWEFSGSSGNSDSLFDDIQKLQAKHSVSVAHSSSADNFLFKVDESFIAPSVVQGSPWINFSQFLVAIVVLMLVFRLLGLSLHECLNSTVLANVVGILALICAWFVAQDVRFNARQIFSDSALNLLLLLWIMLVVMSLVAKRYVVSKSKALSVEQVSAVNLSHIIFSLLVVTAVILAFFMRIADIDLRPLTVDEATIIGFARGVLEKGYPFLMVGGMQVELATYELVPYFIAAAIKLFGYSDFSVRLPALMFGVLTCCLTIYCGTKWFGRLAGLAAGFLYAVSPWAIYWGQNSFHPAQIQFFNLLTLVVFYRLLMADHISIRLAILSACMFALSYLSWEGSGLVLPIMAIVAMVIRWRKWSWFMQVNLWIAALLILFVIGAQGVRRIFLQEPFIMVGFGKSDLAAPKLTFTDPSYEPWYYLQNFFFTESHFSLSLFFVLGFILMFYDKKLSFAVLFVLMAYLSLTNLLGFYNAHYFYFVLPIFLIAVSAVFVKLLMLTQAFSAGQGPIMQIQAGLVAVLLAFFLFIPSSSGLLHMYRLQASGIDQLRVDYRQDLAGMDGRSVSSALRKYKREGDVVLTSIPLVTEHYIDDKGDYFVQTITDRKVVYDTVKTLPYYVDKFVGNPVLRSKQELQDVLDNHARVFFVAAPVNGMTRIIDEETLDFINQHMRVIAESYDSRLYLWER